MTEKNLQPATEQVESTVPETAPQSSDVADPAVSEKKHAIKEALKPQVRRTSVVEDYAAELDEMASLTHALSGNKKSSKGDAWKIGYPYDEKLGRKAYEKEKRALQIELLKLQLWAKSTGQKILIIFEGRDAAGKGGSIKRFTEHLNPRGARVVALEKPTDIEQTQWYFQRYIKHLPSGGEIVMMDRSWYNRAGVERVMGYCTQAQYFEFMREVPDLERMLVNSGIKSLSSGSQSPSRNSWHALPHDAPILFVSGNYHLPIWRRSISGMITLLRKKPCSSTPIPAMLRGPLSSQMIRSVLVWKPCVTCFHNSTTPQKTVKSWEPAIL